MLNPDQLKNRSLNPKRVDNFYVSFLKLSDNVSNLLGRQTKSITRPTLQWETSQTFHRGKQYQNKEEPRFNPITVVLTDDESGLTSMILYAHAFRQQNILYDLYGRSDALDRDYKFDIVVKTYDSRDRMTESFVLKNCFISSIEHSTPIQQSEEDNEITVEISYDNIDFQAIDAYDQLKIDPNF